MNPTWTLYLAIHIPSGNPTGSRSAYYGPEERREIGEEGRAAASGFTVLMKLRMILQPSIVFQAIYIYIFNRVQLMLPARLLLKMILMKVNVDQRMIFNCIKNVFVATYIGILLATKREKVLHKIK